MKTKISRKVVGCILTKKSKYSMRLAEAFYGVEQTKDLPQVNAIGFRYEEEEEDDEEDEEDEDE